jgi:hypothetical protein
MFSIALSCRKLYGASSGIVSYNAATITYLSESAMSESISNNAMILALLALNGEIAIQKEYLDSGEIPEDQVSEEAEVLNDLEQAFMEFVSAYQARARADNTLPSLDELLADEYME